MSLDNRKLAVLLFVPMALLMAAPLSVHAQSNTYYLEVWCNNNDNSSLSASAQLTFLGHTVSVTCSAGGDDAYLYRTISFPSSRVGQFSAVSQAGNVVHNLKGIFTPGSCYAEGGTYDSGYEVYGYWQIYTSECD